MRTIALIFALLTPAATLHAQESTRARRARLGTVDTLHRDPAIARIAGAIVPGAGHVYAGEYGRGVVYFEGTVLMLSTGAMIYIVDKCTFSFLSEKPCKSPPAWPHQAAGVAVMACGVGFWVYGAIDAGHAAERANERHARRRAKLSTFIAPDLETGRANVGLSVAW